jgi:hypothetical protein
MLFEAKTAVVAGGGEIGKPIFQLCRGAFEQVIVEDPQCGRPEAALYPVESLHVAFFGSREDFVGIASGYVEKYNPEITLIHSTTFPGQTDVLIEMFGEDRIVHTQVNGKHTGSRMRRDMLSYPKFVATRSDKAFEKAREVLAAMGHAPENILRLSCPLAGEISKLLATTFFGYLIAWAQEMERLSARSEVAYEELMSFTALAAEDFLIHNKTPGVIGGHCVMPNIDILRKAYPAPLWDYISQSNETKKSLEKKQDIL